VVTSLLRDFENLCNYFADGAFLSKYKTGAAPVFTNSHTHCR
jgi:hypothetical protein